MDPDVQVLLVAIVASFGAGIALAWAFTRRRSAASRSDLDEAIATFPGGFILCDAADRIVAFNDFVRRNLGQWRDGSGIRKGMPYREFCEGVYRELAELGLPDDWVDRRMAAHRDPSEPLELPLPGDRTLQVLKRPTASGGVVCVLMDITDLKRARAEAEARQERLQVAIDSFDDGISMIDSDLRLIAGNDRLLEIYGFPRELKVPGTPFEAYIRFNAENGEYGPGDVDELVRERVELAGRFQAHRIERERPDGTILEIRGNPIPGGGFVTVYSDITERRRAERELKESQERYALAMQGANEGLWDWDIATDTIFASSRALEFLGMTGEPTTERWWAAVRPADRAHRRHAIVRHLKGETDHYVCEYRTCRSDNGREIWVVERGKALRDESGRAVRMAGSIGDITERKQAEDALRESEERLALAVRGANEGLWDWSPSSGVAYLSARAWSIIGFDVPDERHDFDAWRERIHPEDLDHYWKAIRRHLRGETEFFACEYRVCAADNSYRWVADRGLAQRDEEGRVYRMAGSVGDIHARKQAEEELVRAKESAEEASRAKSEFLATMSHELRTPLNAIIGFSDVMRDEMFGPLENDAYREYIADINDSGRHLLALINDILDIAKLEASGNVELQEGPTDIAGVARACLRLIRTRAERAEIELVDATGERLPPIHADERRIKQVILNLLANAVKFTEAGGRVVIGAECRPGDGLLVTVSDTGIGMAPEDIPHALQPFGQIDGKLARQHEGTGLGLPLSKALIERHDGQLEISSHPGQGTTVTLWLPESRVLKERRAGAA